MKVLVIGANGQLGSDLCKELDSVVLATLTHSEVEITDLASVRQALEKRRPDVVINCAAFHRVDDCEDDPDKAFRVNALGSRNVAVVAQELGAKLVFLSTDYVFGGEEGALSRAIARERTTPYTEFDTPVPLSVYGKSKVAGENLVKHLCSRYFIVRASGLFGVAGASGKGGNFVETMLRLAKEKDQLTVVSDQVFSPTYTKDLARKIGELIQTECYGIFHVTNSGTCSWFEFTQEILRQAGLSTPVKPITAEEYGQRAKRPKFSVLDNYHLRLLGMDDMRSWQEALKDYMISKGHIVTP
ncbi:MAG: dTDP-4-dehydrorhamnose reductase [Chloroflexota bacterium]